MSAFVPWRKLESLEQFLNCLGIWSIALVNESLQINHFVTKVFIVWVECHLRNFVFEIVEVALGQKILQVELLLWALVFNNGIAKLVLFLRGSLAES
jgi:hypothetical protein